MKKKAPTKEEVVAFVQNLEIPDDAKKRLCELKPATYIGLANEL
jgi:hypothetical protein